MRDRPDAAGGFAGSAEVAVGLRSVHLGAVPGTEHARRLSDADLEGSAQRLLRAVTHRPPTSASVASVDLRSRAARASRNFVRYRIGASPTRTLNRSENADRDITATSASSRTLHGFAGFISAQLEVATVSYSLGVSIQRPNPFLAPSLTPLLLLATPDKPWFQRPAQDEDGEKPRDTSYEKPDQNRGWQQQLNPQSQTSEQQYAWRFAFAKAQHEIATPRGR
jgi:hypothetical protein